MSEQASATGQFIRWVLLLRAIEDVDVAAASSPTTMREEAIRLTACGQIEAEREARQLVHRRVAGGERITGWQLAMLPVKERAG